jgi:hypothetical protein
MDVEALFCLLNEVEPAKAAFFLEPSEMTLKPGESKVFNKTNFHLIYFSYY